MCFRILSTVLFAFLLAGCQQSGMSTSTVAGASVPVSLTAPTQSVERPNQGHFMFNVDQVVLPAGCSPSAGSFFCPDQTSEFGIACPGGAQFMEYGKGSGEMTHGGRVDVSWHHCTRVSPSKQITFKNGSMVMTTANGDKINFSYGPGGLTVVNGGTTTLIDSPFAITGGDGRFEAASGAGTMHGDAPGAAPVDLIFGRPFATTITGTITYAPGR